MQLKSENWASMFGDLFWMSPLLLDSMQLIQMTMDVLSLTRFTAHLSFMGNHFAIQQNHNHYWSSQ